MAFEFLFDENTAAGLNPGLNQPQSGINNPDLGLSPEINLSFPYIVNPQVSWVAYNCWVECELDSGMALHKPLPQADFPPDTLAQENVDNTSALAAATVGINTISNGQYTDIIQRMATSTYIFKLRGFAVRVGFRIPIPGLVNVAGTQPVPAERQKSQQRLVGNFGGIPMFMAIWDLWYYVVSNPVAEELPPDNLAAHISSSTPLPPFGVVPPFSMPDYNAVAQIKTPPDVPPGGIRVVTTPGT